MKWIKKLFRLKKCEHDWKFVRNIYGDEINLRNGARSLWECRKCGRLQYRKYIELTLKEKLHNLSETHYKNLYNEWIKNNNSTLYDLKQQMIEHAKKGYGSIEISLICDSDKCDETYYEKWFKENKLEVSYELMNPNMKDAKIRQYIFKLNWY